MTRKVDDVERFFWNLGTICAFLTFILFVSFVYIYFENKKTENPSLLFDDLIVRDIRVFKDWCLMSNPVCARQEGSDAYICFIWYMKENKTNNICDIDCISEYFCYFLNNRRRCNEYIGVCEN